MIISDESVNRVHLYYIARNHCANIEMGDIIELGGVKIRHKSSRTKAGGVRVYTYVAHNLTQGWRIHVKVRATDDSFSANIDRHFPADESVRSAVNDWMRSVCS